MKKILLINPGHIYYKRTQRASARGSAGLPLGLLYIGAVMKGLGCEVKIIDCMVSDDLAVVNEGSRTHVGLPHDILKRKIAEWRPDVVGITSQFTSQEEEALKVSEIVKEAGSSIFTIIGGANVSCRGRHLMEASNIDVAVRSEGEETIAQIVEYLKGVNRLDDIRGILFRKDGKIIETEHSAFIKDLDTLPFPEYELVNMETYLTLYKKGVYERDRDVKRSVSMITSRGCPYSCVFCSISQSMGRTWRPHSSDYVSRHIRYLSKRYGVKHIHFEDDNLMLDLKRFERILDTLSEEHITWDTPNGIRVDLSITEDILKKFKSTGCKSLKIGVESGDQQILDKVVKKWIRLTNVEEFAKRCKNVRIPLRAFLVLGFPGETIETMRSTVDYGMHLMDAYGVEIINMIATPLFDTELYRICEEKGYFSEEIKPESLSESTIPDGKGLINTESFSHEDVEGLSREFTSKIYKRLFIRNILLHPIMLLKRIGTWHVFLRSIRRMFLR